MSEDNFGMHPEELRNLEITALREQACEFDETERLKRSAFPYQPQPDWLVEKIQAMYPEEELPDWEEGETATQYVDRISENFGNQGGNE